MTNKYRADLWCRIVAALVSRSPDYYDIKAAVIVADMALPEYDKRFYPDGRSRV